MDFRTFTTRQALATVGACFGLLLLAGPAAAVPDEPDAFSRYLVNHEAHQERGDASAPAVRLRDQPDGFQPQLRTGDSVRGATGDGLDWESTGLASAAIVAAMLLALMSTIALRNRRGLESA